MNAPPKNVLETRLANELRKLGLIPQRQTDRHWRIRCDGRVVDVELDEELGLLCLTSGRLGLIPNGLHDVVDGLCHSHNRESVDASMLLEGDDLYCRMRVPIDAAFGIDARQLLGHITCLIRVSDGFVDRLLVTCLDDLRLRIPTQPESGHGESRLSQP